MTRKGWRTFALAAAAVAGLLATARAVEEHFLDEARKLVEEAKPLVEAANNTDLPMESRRAPRKKAFDLLHKARGLFDQYLEIPANKSMEEKLDEEYCSIAAQIFWLKKESGLGELEKDKDAELPPPATGPAPEGKGEKPSPGDGGGAAGGGAAPGGPPKNESPSEFAWRAKNQFNAIADYEKAHPGDLPVLKQFYEKFLADFSDPSLPEYALAVQKLGRINDKLTTVLKTVAKRDPDSFKEPAGKAEASIYGKLSSEFGSKDPAVRRRAASLMAASRARSATYFLARGLTDKDDEFARICRDGLIALGGSSTGENLVKLYRDASKEKQAAAMDVFTEVTKKGPVDAAAESESIGRFVLSNESDIAEKAIYLLTQMGKVGGPGLMCGLDSVNPVKKIAAMEALAQVKYYKGATMIGDRYLGSKVPPDLRQAAMDCMDKMGVYCFPYLIPVMSNPWVPVVMNKLAGTPTFIRGDQKKARAWWNANKPKDAEDD